MIKGLAGVIDALCDRCMEQTGPLQAVILLDNV